MIPRKRKTNDNSKDITALRAEYDERRKRRSEKNVEEILKNMDKLNDPEYNSDAGKVNGNNVSKLNNQSTVRTLSIAVPASILDNAQSAELRTYLAGQIARAACIFKVDEVIIFNDVKQDSSNEEYGYNPQQSSFLFARILQFLECPQYLRKNLFPIQQSLQYAGLLNPLDAPHHLRATDESDYREGIVTKLAPKPNVGSYASIGLTKNVLVDRILEPDLRVTVKLEPNDGTGKLRGKIVSPSTPRTEAGLYWGYSVRIASTLSQVFSDCPYDGAYDCTIGTSDKGDNCDVMDSQNLHQFDHILILFGGLYGLEAALEADTKVHVSDVRKLFDHYLNTCPNQGSRTIRTEEAILISLATLQKYLPT